MLDKEEAEELKRCVRAMYNPTNSGVIHILEEVIDRETGYSEVQEALEESVKLQSHYAKLLNDYDGGKRLSFDSSHDWIKRLRQLKKEIGCGG